MEELSAKRFVRALRHTVEYLNENSKCFCYTNDKECREVLNDLKFAIRALEDGEEFAGKLLHKNARSLSPKIASAMAEKAKTDEERAFFEYVEIMNLRRMKPEITE